MQVRTEIPCGNGALAVSGGIARQRSSRRPSARRRSRRRSRRTARGTARSTPAPRARRCGGRSCRIPPSYTRYSAQLPGKSLTQPTSMLGTPRPSAARGGDGCARRCRRRSPDGGRPARRTRASRPASARSRDCPHAPRYCGWWPITSTGSVASAARASSQSSCRRRCGRDRSRGSPCRAARPQRRRARSTGHRSTRPGH